MVEYLNEKLHGALRCTAQIYAPTRKPPLCRSGYNEGSSGPEELLHACHPQLQENTSTSWRCCSRNARRYGAGDKPGYILDGGAPIREARVHVLCAKNTVPKTFHCLPCYLQKKTLAGLGIRKTTHQITERQARANRVNLSAGGLISNHASEESLYPTSSLQPEDAKTEVPLVPLRDLKRRGRLRWLVA